MYVKCTYIHFKTNSSHFVYPLLLLYLSCHWKRVVAMTSSFSWQNSEPLPCFILYLKTKRKLYTWTSPNGQYQNQSDYILCSQRQRSSIQSAKTRLGADCGSGHELLIDKFRLKWKKEEKTTRPFRYDLNQLPYGYTVEVTKRFKALDLIECLNTVIRGS